MVVKKISRKGSILFQLVVLCAFIPPMSLMGDDYLYWPILQVFGFLGVFFYVKKYPKLYKFKNWYYFSQVGFVLLGLCMIFMPHYHDTIKGMGFFFLLVLAFPMYKVVEAFADNYD